jgi:hypothetical protein
MNEGNLYNIETSKIFLDRSKVDLYNWKKAVRKQLMAHLADKSPEEIKNIIKTTFGDII